MTTSFLENKILNLQARLKADGDPIEEMPPPSLASPRQGSGRRPKQREYTMFSLFCSSDQNICNVSKMYMTLMTSFSLLRFYP